MAGIQIRFSVPEFPRFQYNVTDIEKNRYEHYMRRFLTYATTAIAAQSEVAKECIKHGSFAAQKVEIENVAKDIRYSMDALAEKSALCVGEELQGVSGSVEKLSRNIGILSLKVDEKMTVTGELKKEEHVDKSTPPAASINTLRNREWRAEKKARKQRRQAATSGSIPKDAGLRNSMEKKWVLQNTVAAERLKRELEAIQSGVSAASTVDPVVKEKELEGVKLETMKIRKQRERIEKEMKDGTFEKELEARRALLDGQIAGRYSLTAPKHVIGFAQTVTATSSSSGAGQSVWSGTGASKLSSASSRKSPSEIACEEKLRKTERSLREALAKCSIMSSKLKEIEERDMHGFNGHYE